MRHPQLPGHHAGAQAPPLSHHSAPPVPSQSATAPEAIPPALAALQGAAEAIWLACHTTWPTLTLDVWPEIGSTNTELMQRGRQGDTAPTLVTALRQTAGRGRLGRAWTAKPGATLTFSLGLPLQLETVPGGGGALSLAVGLAVAEALDQGLGQWRCDHGHAPEATTLPGLGLKWPNDLWLGERKLGGILIEATAAPGLDAGRRWLVIGIGLNVREAPEGAASLADALQPMGLPCPDVGTVWTWIAPALLQAIATFETQGFAPLQAAFAARDVLAGRPVALWTTPGLGPANGVLPNEHGVAIGVDAQGALQVQTDAGLRQWSTGEVSVRPQPR